MVLERLVQSVLAENCYIYHNEKEALLFDPGSDFEAIRDHILNNKLQLKAILLTHLHFDHVGAVRKLTKEFSCEVLASKLDLAFIEGTGGYAEAYGLDTISEEDITKDIKDGDIIEVIAEAPIKAIHTPGHTKGGFCFYLENDNALISGDTLFQSSVGRTDFPGGSIEELEKSIKEKLFLLPDSTAVFPGHAFSTTIGEEKRENPFIR